MGALTTWIFSRHGFFSVVASRGGDGHPGDPIDPDRVMVRARARDHLYALQNRFPDSLGQAAIHESASADYAFRLFVPKSVWADILSDLVGDIDYDNFKAEVAGRPNSAVVDRLSASARPMYEEALHDVWAVMLRLQRRSATGSPGPFSHRAGRELP